MAAKSKHWADVYTWIEKDLLPSCTSCDHLDSIIRILNNYMKIYPSSLPSCDHMRNIRIKVGDMREQFIVDRLNKISDNL
jgi:hypothetical protein